jgi:hypothetical protein
MIQALGGVVIGSWRVDCWCMAFLLCGAYLRLGKLFMIRIHTGLLLPLSSSPLDSWDHYLVGC